MGYVQDASMRPVLAPDAGSQTHPGFSGKLSRLMIRVERVGTLSVLSLALGGVSLILFARNVGSSDASNIFNKGTKDSGQGVFRYGSQLSVQTWLAILGATFGLLSYGLAGTSTHLFDLWSSWRTTRCDEDPGLDYASYLNTQPRAPVTLGFLHGFFIFVFLRYVVVALGIAASIGYKFAVVEVTYKGIEAIPVGHVRLRLPPPRAIESGTTSPWVSDGPTLYQNRAFSHSVHWNKTESALCAPLAIAMVGWANCSGVFHALDSGTLVTREVVMLATREELSTGPVVTTEQSGWNRAESSTAGWFRGSAEPAVIHYRVVDSNSTVQIRWAKRSLWANDSFESGAQQERIQWHSTYKMRYAVAEVVRSVKNSSCSEVIDGWETLLAESKVPIEIQSANASVPSNDKFLAAMLYIEGTGPRDGISAILRSTMATWGAQIAGIDKHTPRLGHAPSNNEPFGKESTHKTQRVGSAHSKVEYPFYDGERAGKQTGSYYAAAEAFMGLGITAIVIAVARVAIGPPMLTSWMGQHVSLAMAMASTTPDQKQTLEEMASGYCPAEQKLGDLRLVTKGGEIRFQFEKLRRR
ncbi:hypothetical protein NEMBOFW57_003813 [Staphylotrichum longicolle]|uniref:Uncharacterized protein n=1 Tax=Staphylotrichum longicolle TaxID=669026 RepID=A0AAD4F5M9_9PEZI|nr:hypothetical protein NEMBOFW57_003813 [Staphylotrichum longicolle]